MEMIFQSSNKPHPSAAIKEDAVDRPAILHSSGASHFSGIRLQHFSMDGNPLAGIVFLEKGG